MDLWTILAAIGSSLGLSMAGVYWLARTLIEHRLNAALEVEKGKIATQLENHKMALTEELESKKASLQKELERNKAIIEGAVQREVELYLGEQAAQRQYAFEARRRLYLAVGPLRFQLLLACRDFAGRIEGHGKGKRYRMNLGSYYGRSTLYRLLRPLAIADLIERQIAYSDFTVDESALDCLRFKKSAFRILSGDRITCNHPRVDWSDQVEHAYADSISIAANSLIGGADGASERVLRFDEFTRTIGDNGLGRFEPFPKLLHDFEISAKPILWLRLVAYGYACNSFVTRAGAALGFTDEPFPLRELIEASGDTYMLEHKAEYERAVAAHSLMAL